MDPIFLHRLDLRDILCIAMPKVGLKHRLGCVVDAALRLVRRIAGRSLLEWVSLCHLIGLTNKWWSSRVMLAKEWVQFDRESEKKK